jgi:hypothetical protein
VMGPELRDRVALIDAVPCTNPHDRFKAGREIDRLQSAAQRQAIWKRLNPHHGIDNEDGGRVEYARFLKPRLTGLLLGMLWNLPRRPSSARSIWRAEHGGAFMHSAAGALRP